MCTKDYLWIDCTIKRDRIKPNNDSWPHLTPDRQDDLFTSKETFSTVMSLTVFAKSSWSGLIKRLCSWGNLGRGILQEGTLRTGENFLFVHCAPNSRVVLG